MLKKKLCAAVVCALIACGMVLAGCHGAVAAQKKLTEVKVSEFRGISWCAVYIAQEKGFFADEGLDVTFVKYGDGPVAFQGMHRNDSQFCLLSQEPVLKAQIEGLKSKLIYTVLDTRVYGFVTAAGIKNVADLKGKAVFAGMPGSAPYSFVSSILREGGLDPEKDVTFINMDYGASAAALANNQIQASYVDVSNYADVIKLNVNFLVDTARPEDSAKYLKSEVFPSQIVVATAKFVEENPETVQAFINAFHRATLWMHENSDEAVADALVPYYAGLTKEGLVDRVKIVKKSLTKTGYIGEKEEEFVQKYCMENGVIPRMIPYDEIVDMTFVNNVNKNK